MISDEEERVALVRKINPALANVSESSPFHALHFL